MSPRLQNTTDRTKVTVKDFMFNPTPLTVKAGATVTWNQMDDEPHTVVSDTGIFKFGGMDTNESYSFKFGKPGTYHFTCSIHPHALDNLYGVFRHHAMVVLAFSGTDLRCKHAAICHPASLGPDRKFYRFRWFRARSRAKWGYAQIQKTRPQTLAYGLMDSPIGQAAWIYRCVLPHSCCTYSRCASSLGRRR